MRRVLSFLEVLFAVTLLVQLPGNLVVRGLNHESAITAGLTLLAFAALATGVLMLQRARWARRFALGVAAVTSVVFVTVSFLAIPLVLLASDVSGRGPLARLWLTLAVQPLVFVLAIFWSPNAGPGDGTRANARQ